MKKVLVIIDMQNDFIDGPLGNDECKQAVPAVIDAVNNGRIYRCYSYKGYAR